MRPLGFARSSIACRKCSGERGAGIVEFALVALLLFTLAAGAYDYGQAWRTGLAANEAARNGARVGSSMGPVREADFNALSGLRASLESAGQLDNLERVVVFNAETADGKVPLVCKTASNSKCQTITGDNFRNTDWTTVDTAARSNGCLQLATQGWCPTGSPARNNVQASAQYYGVWIKLRHDFLFPVMGSGIDIERTAVMRLEPKVE